jgi:hypothetical protein
MQQPALHGIVIDYKDGNCHEITEQALGAIVGVWIILAQGSKQGFKKAGE